MAYRVLAPGSHLIQTHSKSLKQSRQRLLLQLGGTERWPWGLSGHGPFHCIRWESSCQPPSRGSQMPMKLTWPWGPDKQLNSYLSRRRVLLLAGVLGKSPQLMSFYQSMLFLPRLALTCALLSTGKSQCSTGPSLSAQENPISLDGAWNLMRVLHLQSHSQVLPARNIPEQRRAL